MLRAGALCKRDEVVTLQIPFGRRSLAIGLEWKYVQFFSTTVVFFARLGFHCDLAWSFDMYAR